MDQQEKIARQIWLVLERLQEDVLLTPSDEYVVYRVVESDLNPEYPSVQNQLKIIDKLQDLKALKIKRKGYYSGQGPTILDTPSLDVFGATPKSFALDILPDFKKVHLQYSSFNKNEVSEITTPEEFRVRLEDRKILVNSFLLKRPHATGKNLAFLEYVLEHPGELLIRSELPASVQSEIGVRDFSKVLNELGFKKEILQAFFPRRAKGRLLFENPVSIHDLRKRGVDIDLLLQELVLANSRLNPK